MSSPFKMPTVWNSTTFLLCLLACCAWQAQAQDPPQPQWTSITRDDFEDGWGSFTKEPDSRDAKRASTSVRSHQGQYSLRIRDNSGDASSVFHKNCQNVSRYEDLRVSFWFYAVSMEGNEDFFLEYSADGGNTWEVAKQYSSGAEFTNGVFIFSQVEFGSVGVDMTLTKEVRLRFRCDASDNRDRIYLDEILFEGLEPPAETNSPTSIPTSVPSSVPTAAPSPSPSLRPSFSQRPSVSSSVPTTTELTADDICPKNRRYPPEKHVITPYADNNAADNVDDDLNEVSYVAYSTQVDANGNHYAYMASDKEQYSLKVVQFTHNIFDTDQHFNGRGTVVATYTLFTEEPMNNDWEDIALGPCTDTDSSEFYDTADVCIYIGDFGNNSRDGKLQRKLLHLYKFIEPTVIQDQTVPFATIEYNYGYGFDQSSSRYYDGTFLLCLFCSITNADCSQSSTFLSLPRLT